jgi:hypothetical protein
LTGIAGVEGFAFALSVWSIRTTNGRTFIRLKPAPGQAIQYILFCTRNIAVLIGIFNAKDKLTVVSAGKQIIVKNGADTAQMKAARRTGRKSYTYIFHVAKIRRFRSGALAYF